MSNFKIGDIAYIKVRITQDESYGTSYGIEDALLKCPLGNRSPNYLFTAINDSEEVKQALTLLEKEYKETMSRLIDQNYKLTKIIASQGN